MIKANMTKPYVQGALVAQVAKTIWPSTNLVPSNIKRKIGYADEEVAIARKKLSRMEIDDGADGEESNGTDEELDVGKAHTPRC